MAIERTAEAYEAAFEKERQNEYPVIDALEARLGFAVDRARLEDAARVLACPIKKNPPNWCHGRLIYALGRKYLTENRELQTWLDIGTAKGFSAVCMSWALSEAGRGDIFSYDIIDPMSREPRNSVEDGKTVYEFVAPFRGDSAFMGFGVPDSMKPHLWHRINFAFIDGSHTYDGVRADIDIVWPRQKTGDIIMFDDVNKEQVNRAVREMLGYYDIEYIRLLPQRAYAIAVKR